MNLINTNEQYQLLAKGMVENWNYFRKDHPGPIDFRMLANETLQGVNLSGADLRFINFGLMDFRNSKFENAHLDYSELSQAKNLQPDQFKGCVLTGTRLPKAICFDPLLVSVEKTAKIANTLFIGLLLGVIYAVMGAFPDELSLITGHGNVEIPMIGALVPLRSFFFYAFMPLLTLLVYLHYQFYLQHLWQLLSKLPATFPNGISLKDQCYPWFMIGMTDYTYKRLEDPKDFRILQLFLRLLSGWSIGPLIIAIYWINYLPFHRWLVSIWHLVLLFISLMIALMFFVSGLRFLGVESSKIVKMFRKDTIFKCILLFYKIGKNPKFTATLLTLGAILISTMVFMGRAPFRYFYVDLINQEISSPPSLWDGDVSKVTSLDLRQRNFTNADFSGSFLVRILLDDALFWNANLQNADLRSARLAGTSFKNASLKGIDLRFTELIKVDLQKADLRGIQVEGASIKECRFEDAILTKVNLSSVISILECNFNNSNLNSANMKGLTLDSSNTLKNVELGEANLQDTNLISVSFRGSKLNSTRFRNAIISESDFSETLAPNVKFQNTQFYRTNFTRGILTFGYFQGANIYGVDFRQADLSRADFSDVMNWQSAKFEQANIHRIRNAPDGFISWACQQGAVALEPKAWEQYLKGIKISEK